MVPTNQTAAPDMTANDLERYDRYYMVGPNGNLRFNGAGTARLAPWFARHGFTLQACRTEAQFKDTLRQVLASEIVQAQAQLHSMLDSGECTAEERQILEAMLRGSPNLKDINE